MYDHFSRFRKISLKEHMQTLRERSAALECDAGELFLTFPGSAVVHDTLFTREQVWQRYERIAQERKDMRPRPEERHQLRRTFSLIRGKFSFGYGDVYASYTNEGGTSREHRLAYCRNSELTDEILEKESTRLSRAQRVDYVSFLNNVVVHL